MIGPLFYQELLLASRRGRERYFRWAYGGWLVAQLLWFAFTDWWLYHMPFAPPPAQDYVPYLSHHFLGVFLPQHFILIVLATPAFVAGAVSDEKTRGTLQYLLTTDLAPVHIIAGKLLGRIFLVCALSLVGLPLFAGLGALGGVEPPLFLGLLVVTFYVAAGVASATLLAAVWTRQTRDAVLGLAVVGSAAAVVGWWAGGPFDYFNPVSLLEPVLGSGGPEAVRLLGRQLLLGLLAWGGLALACLALATWRLRPAYVRQLESAGRRRLRVPRWLKVAAVVEATVAASCAVLYAHRGPGVTAEAMLGLALRLDFLGLAGSVTGADGTFFALGAVAALLFSLLVGVRCSGSVSGEREHQTWEALLLTPMEVGQMIGGKLWRIMLDSYVYLAAYAAPALLLSLLAGPVAVFWVLLWLGVTVLAMYYLGAAGMWSSVRSQGSWRSLLSTLGFGYVGGFFIYVCLSPVILIIAWIILLILFLLDARFGTSLAPGTAGGFATFFIAFLIATCLGLAAVFWFVARLFLRGARKWVADRERTRHWEDEPTERPRKRRRRRIVREQYDVP
jgi:ABC-type Na+ efflux pump permease subunit